MIFLGILFSGLMAWAQGESRSQVGEIEATPIEVFSDRYQHSDMDLGSPIRVGPEQIERHQTADVHDVMKRVPGVYVIDEDGFGLRPNIGMRGVSPRRSLKTSLMVDGVLTSPSPYSAPAAYYAPNVFLVDDLEVHRGFSSLLYGPNSIGGAVDMRTRPIPSFLTNEITMSAGSFRFSRLGLFHGQSERNFGYSIQANTFRTDGFKDLPSGKSTGFRRDDLLLKSQARILRNSRVFASVQLGQETSQETYLGVTTEDYADDPYKRYAASDRDVMNWEHQSYRLGFEHDWNENNQLRALAYTNRFDRSWYRVNGFHGGVRIDDVVRRPHAHAEELAILRGEADGSNLVLVDNQRKHYSQGLQLNWDHYQKLSLWDRVIPGHLEAGLLLHTDGYDSRQVRDLYRMQEGQLEIEQANFETGSERNKSTQAQSLRLRQSLKLDSWTLQAALRVENVQYFDHAEGRQRVGDEQALIPGVALGYQINPQWGSFLGVSRGVTLSGPGLKSGESFEDSVTYEVGLRRQGLVGVDAVAFLVDYSNIKGVCSYATGCLDGDRWNDNYEGGRARIYGLELRSGLEPMTESFSFPLYVQGSLMNAQFRERLSSESSEWGVGVIESGDPLPYIPSYQVTLSGGVRKDSFLVQSQARFVSQVWDQSVAQERLSVPSYGVVDINLEYRLADQMSYLFFKVDNLFDEAYAVSYRPIGVRPGRSRSYLAGLRAVF